jgi:hypothetical protein
VGLREEEGKKGCEKKLRGLDLLDARRRGIVVYSAIIRIYRKACPPGRYELPILVGATPFSTPNE